MPRLIVMAVMFVHSFTVTAAAISVQVELEVRVNYTGLGVLQSSHFQVSESQQETFSNSPLLGST
jgi:hypothetical protein